MKKPPSTPKTLSSEAKSIWRKLLAEYQIEDEGGCQVLQVGLEAYTRMRDAQKQIASDGIVTVDRFGQTKSHPLLTVERDSRAQYLAALKQLNLDLEPLRDRPGRPGGK